MASRKSEATTPSGDNDKEEEELPVVKIWISAGNLVTLKFSEEEGNEAEFEAKEKLRDSVKVGSISLSNGRQPLGENFRALLKCHGGTICYDSEWYRIQVVPSGNIQPLLPPITPRTTITTLIPASEGKSTPIQATVRMTPSSNDGKAEGLEHASDDQFACMQCTSHPACVELLKIYEDVKTKGADAKCKLAANYVLHARSRLLNRKLPADIGTNERFLTGAMASAMNSFLGDGYAVLHQACLGTGSTHSDLSACKIQGGGWPRTLMVGEGRWNAGDLRKETRGQIFNGLLRHRRIDESNDYRPILLLAFDNRNVEIDLAFPSTKGGKLDQDGVVQFREHINEKSETFWSVKLLRIDIAGGAGYENLPLLFGFLSRAMKILFEWPQDTRVQFKMPMPLSVEHASTIISSTTCGDNVTIVDRSECPKRAYKEFCYHLRESGTGMALLDYAIEKENQRRPPPTELLQALGSPYTDWQVHQGPLGTSVLIYDFIEGSSLEPSVNGWLKILVQIKSMHASGFVHGDLLPRNVLFIEVDEGYVIDFDLSRKENKLYVKGFNYTDFQDFRHEDAREGMPMRKEHDVHSLRQMSKEFFDLGSREIDNYTLEGLIELFQGGPDDVTAGPRSGVEESATGS